MAFNDDVKFRFKKIMSGFDSHKKIERYGIMLVSASTILIAGTTISFIHNNQMIKQRLLAVSGVGTQVNFSKSNAQLTVGKSFLSSDRKTAYITFELSSMDDLSINANNYNIFLQGADYSDVSYPVTGNLILFGGKGRGVIVLHSTKKIENQSIVVYLRSDKNLSSQEQDDMEESMSENSKKALEKINYATFTVNPGSTETQKNPRKNLKEKEFSKMYTSLFGYNDTSKIQKDIKKTEAKIQQQKEIASELRSKLENEGYKVPEDPNWLKDDWRPFDAVNADTGKTATDKSAISYIYDKDSDPDNASYSDSLENKDGTNTNDQIANSSSDEDIGGIQENPADQWSQLRAVWSQIKEDKRKLYVELPTKLYTSKKEERDIQDKTSMGSSTKVNVIQGAKK